MEERRERLGVRQVRFGLCDARAGRGGLCGKQARDAGKSAAVCRADRRQSNGKGRSRDHGDVYGGLCPEAGQFLALVRGSFLQSRRGYGRHFGDQCKCGYRSGRCSGCTVYKKRGVFAFAGVYGVLRTYRQEVHVIHGERIRRGGLVYLRDLAAVSGFQRRVCGSVRLFGSG